MELAKITTRGRTTIPKRIREAAGLHESDVLAFTYDSIWGPVREIAVHKPVVIQPRGPAKRPNVLAEQYSPLRSTRDQ